MKDDLVRRVLGAALVSIAVGLSGCNGCSGCEGQTVTAAPPTAQQPEEAAAVPSATPSAVQASPDPPAAVAVAASVAPNPEHDPTGVRRFCTTNSSNLAVVPDKHKATWKKALEACNEAVEKKTGRKGLEPVRDILTPVGWPAACQ